MSRYMDLNNISPIRESDVAQRRRIQNRNAQRRFREKNRARRQGLNEGEGYIALGDGANHTYQPEQSFLQPCNELDPDRQWHLDDQESLAFLPTMPSATEQAVQQNKTLSVRPKNVPSDYFIEEAISVYRPIPESDASFDFQALSPVEHVGSDILEAEEPYSGPSVAHQQTYERSLNKLIGVSTSTQNSTPRSRLEMTQHANLIAQKQRLHLCDQAEQLLQKLISLYDIGISLDILAVDSHLRHLIISALESFKLQRRAETTLHSGIGTSESQSGSQS